MRRFCLLALALALGCQDYDLNQKPDDVDDPDDTDDTVVTGPQPDIKVTPDTLGFGVRVPDCPSEPKWVTIQNVGELPLEVYSLSVSGNGSTAYAIEGLPATLNTGEQSQVSVIFTARANVQYPASLDVASNDPDTPTASVSLLGEGGDTSFNEEYFTQASPTAVDVLWVLDNSGSMGDQLTELEDGFDQFIGSFVTLGMDYQIGVTTTDMVDTTAQGRLQGPIHVMSSTTMTEQEIVAAFDAAVEPSATGSNTELPLDAAYECLKQPDGFGVLDGLVRSGPDTNLAIIVVTDEDDQSTRNKQWYVSWMDAYKGDKDKTSISGLISQSTSMFDLNCAGMSSPKLEYVIDETGGLREAICDLDFDLVLQWLSFTAAGMKVEFPLSGVPATGAFGILVQVNGLGVLYDPLGQNGWRYSQSHNSVIFSGAAIPGPGATIYISYPIEAACAR